MLKVNKRTEPIEFTEYKRKNKIINWDSYNYEIKEKLRKNLLEEQEESRCPYCEIKISLENSHIEHIKPKDKFPAHLSDYRNLISCCNDNKRCGASKENKWNDLFINPVLENPEEYFKYDIKTGKILPTDNSGAKYDKANITIEFLNLNESRICDARKNYIIQFLKADLSIRNYLNYYPSLKRYLEKIS
ncbi:MAG: retron system putative HNH endonuclease [Fusobacterium gastrosuis]|uniref:retron system putative HNH endonuclease n=1 Tax=Fusobacterium gastrosuis TaxID=1755100 RepID=UPI002A8E4990|nr:retron system putative HNH endonuclease [Fusobacterium gastrosuis]